jgi:hypothetical protein
VAIAVVGLCYCSAPLLRHYNFNHATSSTSTRSLTCLQCQLCRVILLWLYGYASGAILGAISDYKRTLCTGWTDSYRTFFALGVCRSTNQAGSDYKNYDVEHIRIFFHSHTSVTITEFRILASDRSSLVTISDS